MGHAHPGDERRRPIGTNDAPSDRCLGTAQGARERHRGPVLQAPARNAPALRSRKTATDIAAPTFQSHGKETPVQRFPTSPRDATVPISQPTTNATPGSRSLAEVPISQPCSKPPDPKANEVAPRRSARLAQKRNKEVSFV